MIDLSDRDLKEVRNILRYAPDCEVWAFGSRVRGCSQPYSDLDLALIAPGGTISGRQLTTIKDAFAESDLPIRVDILDWHALTDCFQKVINERHEVLQERNEG